MKYRNVCLESLGYTLPAEIVSSEQLEQRLEPLYSRLKLPSGRLELMTGIRQRRFWPRGTRPSQVSVLSGERAIAAAGIDRNEIGALIHGSVCRDFLEPATASIVHRGLKLSRDCLIYDVSNACLGLMNGMVQVANMIELGQIRAGLVLASEGSRELVETTVNWLNSNTELTRESVKPALASLTIGSASAAALLVHRDISRTGNSLVGAIGRANTDANELCHSGRDEAVATGMAPLMQTHAESLMHEGIAVGTETLAKFLAELNWTTANISKTVCHQVGGAHRKMLLEKFGFDPTIDFVTFPILGNTGAAALPVTLALGMEQNHFQSGDRIGMFGIGSGINVLMMGLEFKMRCTQGASFG